VRARIARLWVCERGFSLSEMLTVIVVLAFIGAAFAALFSSVVNHSATVSDSITLQTEARGALDRFASDFRQAYNGDPAFNPSSPVESLTAGTAIQFTTPDRQNPLRLRRVSYRISGGVLQRADVFTTDTDGWPWVWAGGGVVGTYRNLVGNITTAAPFTFYDANGSTTTTASAVTGVTLDFVVRTNRGRSTRFIERVTVRSDI
jgi:prepilin-type N-terminal cleavage/methylation domain-containing protein